MAFNLKEYILFRTEIKRELFNEEVDRNFQAVANPWTNYRRYEIGDVVYHPVIVESTTGEAPTTGEPEEFLVWWRANKRTTLGTFIMTQWDIIGGVGGFTNITIAGTDSFGNVLANWNAPMALPWNMAFDGDISANSPGDTLKITAGTGISIGWNQAELAFIINNTGALGEIDEGLNIGAGVGEDVYTGMTGVAPNRFLNLKGFTFTNTLPSSAALSISTIGGININYDFDAGLINLGDLNLGCPTLDLLCDVTYISGTPTAGDLLQWSGSEWENIPISLIGSRNIYDNSDTIIAPSRTVTLNAGAGRLYFQGNGAFAAPGFGLNNTGMAFTMGENATTLNRLLTLNANDALVYQVDLNNAGAGSASIHYQHTGGDYLAGMNVATASPSFTITEGAVFNGLNTDDFSVEGGNIWIPDWAPTGASILNQHYIPFANDDAANTGLTKTQGGVDGEAGLMWTYDGTDGKNSNTGTLFINRASVPPTSKAGISIQNVPEEEVSEENYAIWAVASPNPSPATATENSATLLSGFTFADYPFTLSSWTRLGRFDQLNREQYGLFSTMVGGAEVDKSVGVGILSNAIAPQQIGLGSINQTTAVLTDAFGVYSDMINTYSSTGYQEITDTGIWAGFFRGCVNITEGGLVLGESAIMPDCNIVTGDNIEERTLWINSADGHLYRGNVDVEAGSGVTMCAISDVDCTGLADGYILTYDAGSTDWIVGPNVSTLDSLCNLVDVDCITPGPQDGEILVYNGGTNMWENVTTGSLGLGNIYTQDGALTGSRTVDLNGFKLLFGDISGIGPILDINPFAGHIGFGDVGGGTGYKFPLTQGTVGQILSLTAPNQVGWVDDSVFTLCDAPVDCPTGGPADGDGLFYSSSTGMWEITPGLCCNLQDTMDAGSVAIGLTTDVQIVTSGEILLTSTNDEINITADLNVKIESVNSDVTIITGVGDIILTSSDEVQITCNTSQVPNVGDYLTSKDTNGTLQWSPLSICGFDVDCSTPGPQGGDTLVFNDSTLAWDLGSNCCTLQGAIDQSLATTAYPQFAIGEVGNDVLYLVASDQPGTYVGNDVNVAAITIIGQMPSGNHHTVMINSFIEGECTEGGGEIILYQSSNRGDSTGIGPKQEALLLLHDGEIIVGSTGAGTPNLGDVLVAKAEVTLEPGDIPVWSLEWAAPSPGLICGEPIDCPTGGPADGDTLIFNSATSSWDIGSSGFWEEGSVLIDILGNHTVLNPLSTDNSIIAGGQNNTMDGSRWSSIVGGDTSSIEDGSERSIITGGGSHHIRANSTTGVDNAAIIGGFQHRINDEADESGIFAGAFSTISSPGGALGRNAIIGGSSNSIINSENSIIIGGSFNQIGSFDNVTIISGSAIVADIADFVFMPALNIGGAVTTPTTSFKLEDGSESAGHVLTSDAFGNADWQAVGAGFGGIYAGSGTVDVNCVATLQAAGTTGVSGTESSINFTSLASGNDCGDIMYSMTDINDNVFYKVMDGNLAPVGKPRIGFGNDFVDNAHIGTFNGTFGNSSSLSLNINDTVSAFTSAAACSAASNFSDGGLIINKTYEAIDAGDAGKAPQKTAIWAGVNSNNVGADNINPYVGANIWAGHSGAGNLTVNSGSDMPLTGISSYTYTSSPGITVAMAGISSKVDIQTGSGHVSAAYGMYMNGIIVAGTATADHIYGIYLQQHLVTGTVDFDKRYGIYQDVGAANDVHVFCADVNICNGQSLKIHNVGQPPGQGAPASEYNEFMTDPAQADNYVYQWPADGGTAGQVLTSDGAAATVTNVLSWTTPTPAPTTQLMIASNSSLASSGTGLPTQLGGLWLIGGEGQGWNASRWNLEDNMLLSLAARDGNCGHNQPFEIPAAALTYKLCGTFFGSLATVGITPDSVRIAVWRIKCSQIVISGDNQGFSLAAVGTGQVAIDEIDFTHEFEDGDGSMLCFELTWEAEGPVEGCDDKYVIGFQEPSGQSWSTIADSWQYSISVSY